MGMEIAAVARSADPVQNGGGAAPKTGTVGVEEPKSFASLFSGGAAAAPAGARVGNQASPDAGPAHAGSEHSRGQHALLIYPKKTGLSAGLVLKENFDLVSLNLGAVSLRAIRGGGVAAKLVKRKS